MHVIREIKATPVNVPLSVDVGPVSAKSNLSGVVVEITTQSGLTEHGFTAITEEEVVAAAKDMGGEGMGGLCDGLPAGMGRSAGYAFCGSARLSASLRSKPLENGPIEVVMPQAGRLNRCGG